MDMSPITRRAGLVLATSAVALTCLSTAPASAVTVPDWPLTRLPSGAGCAITSYTPFTDTESGLNEYTFSDTAVPAVTGWTVNNRTGSFVLVPGSNLMTFRVNATQNCGGVGAVTAGIMVGSTRVTDGFPLVRDSSDAFRSVWRASVSMTPSNAGAYRIPTVTVAQRYSSVVLTDTWSLVTKTDYAGTPAIVTGAWSNAVVYVRRATTQVTSASRSIVRKGTKVTVRTILRKAGTSSYVAAAGATVILQTRVKGGSWSTRATRKTGSTGIAVYTFVPTRTMSWRWIHKGTTSVTFTAPSTSAAKLLTVR
jgi:hypothetical protein